MRFETALWQTTLHGHLTALKAYLVVAAGARFLALVTTTSSLAEARANAATNATLGVFCARCVGNVIEFHL
jgi:hypothetical protein